MHKDAIGCLRNTARWPCLYRMYYETQRIIPTGRLIFNHFPQRWQHHHTTETFKGESAHSKRGNHDAV